MTDVTGAIRQHMFGLVVPAHRHESAPGQRQVSAFRAKRRSGLGLRLRLRWAFLTWGRGWVMTSSDRTATCYGLRLEPAASELDDAMSVAVRVLEPCHPFVAQLGDPLLVRLEPIGVVVLEGDAVGGQFVHCLLHVNDLPGRDRAA